MTASPDALDAEHALRARLPAAAAYRTGRGKDVLLTRPDHRLSRRRPAVMKARPPSIAGSAPGAAYG